MIVVPTHDVVFIGVGFFRNAYGVSSTIITACSLWMRRTKRFTIFHKSAAVCGWLDKKRVIWSWLMPPFSKLASPVAVVCPNELMR